MRQVLFEIPLPFGDARIPIFGYGVMLFIAFLVCTWLAGRRAKQEGINPQYLWDMAVWAFLGGLIGGRSLSMFLEPKPDQGWVDFFKIWEGGLVFYGSIIGGLIACLLHYFLVLKKLKLPALPIADLIAPSIAMGIFLGRIGCFLTGCCYGDVAVDSQRVWWAVQFPTNSPPQQHMVGEGWQTAYGFTLAEDAGPPRRPQPVPVVQAVEPAAWEAGLRPGDQIVKVGAERIDDGDVPLRELQRALIQWPGREPLRLTVARPNLVEITFQAPSSLPLHPAQLYSSFDGLVLFLLLTAFYPFRQRPGEVMALLMIGYAITRFLTEKLRSDNPPVWHGLTQSQLMSIVLLTSGVGLAIWLYQRPETRAAEPAAAAR